MDFQKNLLNRRILGVFLSMTLLISSCGRDDKKETENDQKKPDAAEPGAAERTEGSSATYIETPIYLGNKAFKSFFVEEYRKKNASTRLNPVKYTRDSIIAFTVPYVHRVNRSHNPNPPQPIDHVNRATEKLILYLDRTYVEELLNLSGPNCTGLIAILATEKDSGKPKHQTFILVPFDRTTNRALVLGTDTAVSGYERWPGEPETIESLATGNVTNNVSTLFDSLGIK